MRKITYLAVLEPSSDGGYGVFFPDLPGCVSFGETIEEAQEMAAEAAGLHVYGLEQDGDPVPVPSLMLEAEDTEGCIVSPVSIFPDIVKNELDNKRVKTNTTLPSWLKRIAEEEKVNFSRVLETALMDYLGLQDKVPNRENVGRR